MGFSMRKFSSVCIVAGGYPTNDNPNFAFIQPVARGFADNGITCSVIAAQSLTNAIKHRKKLRPRIWQDISLEGNIVNVFQPVFISFSSKTPRLNAWLSNIAIKNVIKKNHLNPDVVYGHFWHSAISGARAFENVPVIAVTGESKIWIDKVHSKKEIQKQIKKISGVISVSTENIQKSTQMGLLTDQMKTIVLPNAVDNNVFKKSDRHKERKELKIPDDDFVIIFVGAFSERKGVTRVLNAIKTDSNIKAIFIGNGELPSCPEQIIYHGVVAHEKIPKYLNASDVFVLPTLAEGCCNAIVEAIACGVPVISSDLPFNYDVLDDTCSILVDPNDINALRDVIVKIENDKALKKELSIGALKKAEELTISRRVQKIIGFIESTL